MMLFTRRGASAIAMNQQVCPPLRADRANTGAALLEINYLGRVRPRSGNPQVDSFARHLVDRLRSSEFADAVEALNDLRASAVPALVDHVGDIRALGGEDGLLILVAVGSWTRDNAPRRELRVYVVGQLVHLLLQGAMRENPCDSMHLNPGRDPHALQVCQQQWSTVVNSTDPWLCGDE